MTEDTDRINEARPRRFSRYPEYKDSGIAWLGEIPAHWRALPIKRVCRLCYGESLAGNDRANGEIVVFGSNGPVGTHDSANTGAPCLIVGRKGSFGKVNYSADAVFAIDTTFVIDARYTQADLRWLYYTLKCARLDTISKDSAIPGLDREDAYARVIALGPIHEQRAIAALLDRETAKIDGLVERKERLIELLQEKRTALITRAVTRGLDPNVPMKDSGVEWLGEIPVHWCIAPVYARYEVALGKMLDAKGVTGKSSGKYLRNVDVQWDSVNVEDLPEMDFPPSVRNRYLLRPEDLLVCEGGEVGRTAIWGGELDECFYQKAIHRVRPWFDSEIPRFFYFLMYGLAKRGVFTAGGNPNTINHLTAVQLRHYRLPFPATGEQRAIAAFLDRETAKIDALIAKIRQAINHLKEFRTALISAAVTGRIDVRSASAETAAEPGGTS